MSVLILLIWSLGFSRENLLYTYTWQLKEYRWDRMLDFLKSKKGQQQLRSPLNILRVALFFALITYSTQVFWGLILLLAFTNLVALGVALKTHRLYRPKLTARMGLTLAFILSLEIILFFLFKIEPATLLGLALIRPILATFAIQFVGIPFFFYKKYLLHKAAKKRLGFMNLKVIGITGSYGKSSTKEFLYQILKSKFRVSKTPSHVNVDIGIAQTILNTVSKKDEIFIVEMGAYTPGEIASSCRVAQPNIGIITGVNEQHLSFFKKIETTIKSKAELFAALPTEGLAIVNMDSPNARKTLAYSTAKRSVTYSTQEGHDLRATEIKQKGNVLHFKVEGVEFKVPIFGEHYVQNLLACIAASLELGLTLKEIAKYAQQCQLLEGSFQIFEGKKGCQIIDDSYNANPDGFLLALKMAKDIKTKKLILVTPGMMELGDASESMHKKIGHSIATSCDSLIVTSEDAYEALCEASRETKTTLHLATKTADMISAIEKELEPGSLILFENRVPQVVINHFKKA